MEHQHLFSGVAFTVSRSCGPSMLIVWPLPSWVAAAKLWPVLPCCSPNTHSSTSWQHVLSSVWKTSLPLSICKTFISSFLPIFLFLFASLSFRLSIYHSQLCCQLPCFPVSKGWKRCLSVKKNLQLCFISPLTTHCSCLWLSAAKPLPRHKYHFFLWHTLNFSVVWQKVCIY